MPFCKTLDKNGNPMYWKLSADGVKHRIKASQVGKKPTKCGTKKPKSKSSVGRKLGIKNKPATRCTSRNPMPDPDCPEGMIMRQLYGGVDCCFKRKSKK